MIRVYPISAVQQVRACLTLLGDQYPVLAIKGCARTAKIFALRRVRNHMRATLRKSERSVPTAVQRREWNALERSIVAIEY